MNNGSGIGILAVLAALIIGGIAVETGMVGGGVYDIIRTIVLIVIVIAAICAIALVAFLIWFAKHPQGTSTGTTQPNIHVHSSSANEAAGIRYVDNRDDTLPQGTVPSAPVGAERTTPDIGDVPPEALGDIDDIVEQSNLQAQNLASVQLDNAYNIEQANL